MALTYQDILNERNQKVANLPLNANPPLSAAQVGRVGAGLVTEIAVGEGAKWAGAALGGSTGPLAPVLAPAGYIIGGLGGGATGSIAAQRIEKPNGEISWGRVLADSLINLLPAGKAVKGTTTASRLGKVALKGAAVGAGIGAGGRAVETYVDDHRAPTLNELTSSGISGAYFGSVLGLGGEGLAKLSGKSAKEIDEGLLRGDKDIINATNLVNDLLGDRAAPSEKSWLAYVSSKASLGKPAHQIITQAMLDNTATKETAKLWKSIMDDVLKKSDNPLLEGQLGDFLMGRSKIVPQEFKKVEKQLTWAREESRALQETVLRNDATGRVKLPEGQREVIEAQLHGEVDDYTTRQYRMFNRSPEEWRPDPSLREAVVDEWATQPQYRTDTDAWILRKNKTTGKYERSPNPNLGKKKKIKNLSRDEINQYLDELEASRNADFLFTGGSSGKNSLKRINQNLSTTFRRYLGEFESPTEQMEQTISRLADLALYAEADQKLINIFTKSGFAKTAKQGINPETDAPLKLKRGFATDLEGNALYAPKHIQKALNDFLSLFACWVHHSERETLNNERKVK